jgi:uncharacterized protein YbcC (UPF0753/DUF2309 family)
MLEVMEVKMASSAVMDWSTVVARSCAKIPPLWDLSNYVAVNPFLGFSKEPWVVAARHIADGLGAAVLPPVEFYRQRWKGGDFGVSEVAAAARRCGEEPGPFVGMLKNLTAIPSRPHGGTLSLAELHDLAHNTHWNDALNRSISRWCAVYAERGGAFWSLAGAGEGLYCSWREAAQVDRTLEIVGLKGWRKWVATLPASATEAIDQSLSSLGIEADDAEGYLYRLLSGLYGWASFFRRSSWPAGAADHGPLVDLLAIRLCADAAVAELALKTPSRRTARRNPSIEEESVRAVFQEALEDGYIKRLIAKFLPPAGDESMMRPMVQAVFCIDVRSEPFRRHFEAQSEGIETLGFAGFFGVALDWKSGEDHSARCPVLLKPSVHICSAEVGPDKTLAGAVKQVQGTPAASFSFVETLGLTYGIRLAKDSWPAKSSTVGGSGGGDGTAPLMLEHDAAGHGLTADARLTLAAGILTTMGLRSRFARLVLLCGHESLSTNNPHAASLDCGACGGHSGSINARIAAALLNDPAVRAGLDTRGIHVPRDTWFIPGVHNTTIDEVELLDIPSVPVSHSEDLTQLKAWLGRAGELNRQTRAASLGLASEPLETLKSRILKRGNDWSEVRPEWGLAGNAAFIAGRRKRTRGVDLQGRSFLHEYDWQTDADGSILTLILCAPMVVASWINLQYFASTVDNKMLGCGTKTLHNRVGSLGVVLGNSGDLRTGLALQSVHAPDGSWYHQPLRLQVIVESPTDRIDRVLENQSGVRDLVKNGWVRLFALNPEGQEVSRWLSAGVWESVESDSSHG